MNKRIALVLAAFVPLLIVVVAVVATRGGTAHRPAKLPVAAGGPAAGARADTAASGVAQPAPALYPNGGLVYGAGDGLPALDGSGRAYRLGPVGDDEIRRLASALGVNGDPVDQGGSRVVVDGDHTLTVYPQAGGAWSYFSSSGAGSSSGVVSSPGATGGGQIACPSDGVCPAPDAAPPDPVEPPMPERPTDLPSQDEAKAKVLDLLRAAGVDVDGADVHVDDAFTSWSVRVDPVVDGVPTSGLTSYVAIGSGGAIEYGNGYLAAAVAGDEYPLTGTAVAIERMNRGEGFGGGVRPLAADTGAAAGPAGGAPTAAEPVPLPSLATDAPGTVEPAKPVEPIAPGEPAPPGTIEPVPIDPEPIEPQHITLTGARHVLLFTPSVDGSEGWLVPGYAFTAGEDFGPVVMAVAGEFLQ